MTFSGSNSAGSFLGLEPLEPLPGHASPSHTRPSLKLAVPLDRSPALWRPLPQSHSPVLAEGGASASPEHPLLSGSGGSCLRSLGPFPSSSPPPWSMSLQL